MSIRIFETPPAGYNREAIIEQAQARWGADFKGIGEVDDGTIVFGFTDAAMVTQGDVNSLLGLPAITQPSLAESRQQARLQRRAVLKAALDGGTLAVTHLSDMVRELLGE